MTFSDMLQDWASAVAKYEAQRPATNWMGSKYAPPDRPAFALLELITTEWQTSSDLTVKWGHTRSYTYKKLLQLEAHGCVLRRGVNNKTEWRRT